MKNLLNRLTKVALLMLLLVDRTPFLNVYAGNLPDVLSVDINKFTVNGNYQVNNIWTIGKTANKDTLNLNIGESDSVNYTITADLTTNSTFKVVFELDIENVSNSSRTFDLIASVETTNGHTIYGTELLGTLTMAAGAKIVNAVYPVTIDLAGQDVRDIVPFKIEVQVANTNFLNEQIKGTKSAAINSLGPVTEIDGSLTVTDSRIGKGPWVFTEDGTQSYSILFNADTAPGSRVESNTITSTTTLGVLTSTVNVTVNTLNRAPVAISQDILDIVEEVAKPIVLTGTDPDGDALTYVVLSSPTKGSLTGTGPNLTYTPITNLIGSDSFTFRVVDVHGALSNIATVNLSINNVNDAPVAVENSYSTNEDTALTVPPVGILGNDTDIDNTNLTAILVSDVSDGLLSLNADGSFTYTPDANFNGSDSFTYKANDGSLDSNIVSVSITINAINEAPVAKDDVNVTDEDVSLVFNAIDLLENDADIDGDLLAVTSVSNPTNGTVTLVAGVITFTPSANYNGSGGFDYVVSDGVLSDTGHVNITINSINDAPLAVANTYTTDEDTSLVVPINGVLGNDSDIDSTIISAILVSGPTKGSLTLNADGSFTYTPESNFNGSDSFTYKANDGSLDSNIVSVSITINAINEAPVAGDDVNVTNEDSPLVFNAIDLLGNDADIDGDLLTVTSVSNPTNGTVSLVAGVITFTPSANYNGSGGFDYVVSDGTLSDIGHVNITINSINDLPVAGADTYTAFEDTLLTIVVPGVLANDTDVENNGLTAAILIGFEPTRGSINLNPDGSFTYTPFANLHGEDTFMYKITDGDSATATALVTINVQSEEDNPLANPKSFSVNEGSTYNGFVTGTDDDGDALLFELVTSPVNGTLSFNNLGVFVYTHNGNETIADSFTFRVSDDDGLTFSAPATVSITVNPINDAPIASPQTVTTPEDTARSITLTGSDVETNPLLLFGVTIQPLHGTLSGTAPNLIYTPALNYVGPDSFTFALSDGYYRASNVVDITVTPVDDLPVANLQNLTTAEDTTLSITLTGSDVETNPISLFGVTIQPLHGSLTGTAPNLVYTPALNYVGPDSFTFALSDGYYRASNVINIEVTPVNDPPVATPQTLSTPEDTALPIVLAATDVEGSVSIYGILSAPSHGTLTGSGANRSYTPDLNYSGPDSFTFGVSDGFYRSFATVTIDVTPVNDLPIATPQTLITAEDTALPITLAGTDIETTPITLFGVTVQPLHGTLTGTAPSLIYTPALNYVGPDSFTFAISDGFYRDTAVVSITVTSVEDIPVAIDDPDLEDEVEAFETPEDTPYVFDLDTLLANDFDPDDSNQQELPDFFSIQLFMVPSIIRSFDFNAFFTPSVGNLVLDMDLRTLTYTPPLNYVGPVTFEYDIIDEDDNVSEPAEVILTVTPVNDLPIATPQALITAEDTALPITLAGTDTETTPITLFGVTVQPTNGVISGTGQNITYTPNANYVGPDSFTFAISDGFFRDTAVVSLTVTPVNDAPVANPLAFTVPNAGTSTGSVTATDVDLPANTLTYSLLTPATNGTATVSPTGTYTYSHNGTGTLSDAFVFSVTDGTLSATATVTVTVLAAPTPPPPPPANLAPSATAFAFTVANAGTNSGTLSGSDPEGATLSFTLVGAPANGTVVISPAGAYSYTHDGTTTVTDSFTFAVSDGALSATATVSITVLPIPAPGNTAPVVIDGIEDGPFGGVIVGTVEPLGSDADGDPLTFSVLVGPTNGTLVLNPDGTFTYTPDADFAGEDTFSFIANDGTDDSNEGTFTLDVQEEIVIIPEPETPLAAVNNDWIWWLLALLAGLLLWLLAFLRPNMKYTLTDNENNQKVVLRRLAKPEENTMLVELSDKDMLNIQTIDVEFYKRFAKHLGNVTINFQLNGKVIHSVTLPEGIKDSFETLIRL